MIERNLKKTDSTFNKLRIAIELANDEVYCKELISTFKSDEAIIAIDKLRRALYWHRKQLK